MKAVTGRLSLIPWWDQALGLAIVAAATGATAGVTLLGQRGAVADPTRGKTIYATHCVECHGADGRGDGPAAPVLTPRPRDFTSGKYEIRTTETGSLPTDQDLVRSVEDGLAATAMPGWKGVLRDDEIRDVVGYIKSLSPRFGRERVQEVTLGPDVPRSPESVARGAVVYQTLQCSKCHGIDGRGADAVTTEFEDDWGQPLKATDLTEPWTFRGGSTPRDISLRFRTGMSGTPMPSFKEAATDEQMWDLANYVASLGRKPVWEMNHDEVAALYARNAEEADENPVARGESLADTLLCALCHSPVDEEGRILPELRMAGGQLIRVTPFGDFPTANLTSDRQTGLGGWTDDQIKAAITRGERPDGSRLLPYPMDWASYSALSPDDLDALVAYLRSIPPISNQVPAPSRPFLPVYLWGKFKMLILGIDPPILIYPGNVGTPMVAQE
jgi:cbb3-type cytochrome c oxidase subunit III